jgi:hypothetical protein
MNKRDKIEEAYVSFDVAKLLWEKGFNEECRAYRVAGPLEEIGVFTTDLEIKNFYRGFKPSVGLFTCPTQQMAMQWLRKKHKLHIEIRTTKCHDFFYVIYGLGKKYLCISCEYDKGEYWAEPEEAIEDALKYILTKVI